VIASAMAMEPQLRDTRDEAGAWAARRTRAGPPAPPRPGRRTMCSQVRLVQRRAIRMAIIRRRDVAHGRAAGGGSRLQSRDVGGRSRPAARQNAYTKGRPVSAVHSSPRSSRAAVHRSRARDADDQRRVRGVEHGGDVGGHATYSGSRPQPLASSTRTSAALVRLEVSTPRAARPPAGRGGAAHGADRPRLAMAIPGTIGSRPPLLDEGMSRGRSRRRAAGPRSARHVAHDLEPRVLPSPCHGGTALR